jgi:hypothetical protein
MAASGRALQGIECLLRADCALERPVWSGHCGHSEFCIRDVSSHFARLQKAGILARMPAALGDVADLATVKLPMWMSRQSRSL